MIATPIFDEVAKTHPYPTDSIDVEFRWDPTDPARYARAATTTPRPGVKPIRKRKTQTR